jgi:hypothetical protein
MLFGLPEVALPSLSEAKRACTLIQLLIRLDAAAKTTRGRWWKGGGAAL